MKREIRIIILIFFIQGILHNFGHPITTTYVEQLGLPNYMFGYFFSAMSLGLLVGAPIWGSLGDMYGKKKFIAMGILGYSIGQFGFGYFDEQWILVGFRFLSGFLVIASPTLLLAKLSDLSTEEDRTKVLSLSTAAATLGSTIGYKIGGILGLYYIREVFFIQAGINVIFALFVYLVLKEDYGTTSNKKQSIISNLKNVKELNDKKLILFLFTLTIISMAQVTTSKFLDVYVIHSGYIPKDVGDFVFVTGLIGITTNLLVVPLLSKLNKDRLIMKIALLSSAIFIFITFRFENLLTGLYSVFLLYIVSKAIFTPLEQSYISKQTKDKHGMILGIRQSFVSIGFVIGPIIAGYLYEVEKVLIFQVNSVLFLIAFILLIIVDRKNKNTNEVH